MRYLLSRRIPPFRKVLIIESGSRSLLEDLIPGLYDLYGPELSIDLVTCYAGIPQGFDPSRGAVYRVTDYAGAPGRARLYQQLRARRYNIAGIICSGEPIMTKWKWMLAARLPSKVFILNENGDYFWLDWGNWKFIRHFVLVRAGLSGAGAVQTLVRLALFPFMIVYLLGFAALMHLRRKVHV